MYIKKYFGLLVISLLPVLAFAQHSYPDSLRIVLRNATTDSAGHNASYNLYLHFLEANRDSALQYVENRLMFAKRNTIKLAEATALISRAYQYNAMGRYSEAFTNLLQALKIAEDPANEEVQGWKVVQYPIPGKNRQIVLATIHHVLAGVMRNAENHEREIIELREARRIATEINHPDRQMTANMNLGTAYLEMNQLDSALYYAKEAERLTQNPLAQGYAGNNMVTIGDIFLAKGDVEKAKAAYYEGLQSSTRQNNQADVANLNHRLFRIYLTEKNKDSVLSYAIKNLPIIKSVAGVGYRGIDIGVAYEDLYKAYQLTNQIENVYKYQSLALITKDSLYKVRIKNLADFQKLSLDEALRLENLEKERIKTQSNIRTYGMLSGITVLSVIGYILYRSNRQKHKTNMVLQEQKEKVENALSQLKSTQSQLIQSEKMASLGELTAGIAHEIQNPLNFVNNFSEVNLDLIRDLKSEIRNNNLEEVNLLTNDIESNSEKINHHGKRAADIVRGMLQHSRTSTGQKELTDINALCDEYLRLAYHGLRAKDKAFNAKFETSLDPTLPKLNVIPQDLGRVLLNLINNAFYAVSERLRQAQPGSGYEPRVTVSTKNLGNKIEISIRDNGTGIPDKVKEKIFQPFFTTKPTGQGTGLGLSLSYDIVKAHGGDIKLGTVDGEGTVFTINLAKL